MVYKDPNTDQLNEAFWTKRYNDGETGWNIGAPSTPLTEYIDKIKDKDIRILLPGAGNAYEAEYLHKLGFKNISVLDISKAPLLNLKARGSAFEFFESQKSDPAKGPSLLLIHSDFFDHKGSYDLILEQTFFCALHPSLRKNYVSKVDELLCPGGKLAGVMFNFPFDPEQEMPPFGGSIDEYLHLFTKFNIKTLEPCYNSIPNRAGKELFCIFEKPGKRSVKT